MTGAHHSRDPTSVHMNFYMLLNLLFDYSKGDPEARYLIDNFVIQFIPIVNVDGYKYVHQINTNQTLLGKYPITIQGQGSSRM